MQEKIKAFVAEHRESMLADIARLVAVRSVKGQPRPGMPYGPGPAAALEAMADLAQGHGFAVRNVDGYMLEVNLNDKPDGLGILCHLDIVHEGSGWTTPPFEMAVRDGKIFGRGVADNKGPAVAALYAMKCVRQLGLPLSANVRLMLGTDEESGSSDLEAYWQRATPPPFCFSPDAAFPVYNIEKGRFAPLFSAAFTPDDALPQVLSIQGGHAVNIVPDRAEARVAGLDVEAARALARQVGAQTGTTLEVMSQADALTITAQGTGTHASYPEDGNNALTGLLALLAALPLADSPGHRHIRALAQLLPHGDYAGAAAGIAMEDALSGPLTCNLGTLTYTPEGLEGGLDIRSPICGTRENVALALDSAFRAQGLALSTTDMVLPHHIPQELPFVQTLLEAFSEVTGLEGQCLAMGGGTYVHGMPNSVAFGAAFPDTETNAHAPDEFAVIAELEACVEIFARVIIRLCGK